MCSCGECISTGSSKAAWRMRIKNQVYCWYLREDNALNSCIVYGRWQHVYRNRREKFCVEGKQIVLFKCCFPDAKLSQTDVLRACQNFLIPPCLIPNEIFSDKLFLALNVLCGVCTGGCHPVKFWPIIRTTDNLNPLCSGEMKARVPYSRMGWVSNSSWKYKPLCSTLLGFLM